MPSTAGIARGSRCRTPWSSSARGRKSIASIRRARPPITEAALCELDGLVPCAETWLDHIDVLADAVAEACGVPRERAHGVLEDELRVHLAFLARRERASGCSSGGPPGLALCER
jgi:hypothetical protein